MALAPDSRLARRVLPGPLYRALTHVFAQGISGCMLETALASLLGTEPSRSSWGFSLTQTPDEVLREISVLKRNLESLARQDREEPAGPGDRPAGARAALK